MYKKILVPFDFGNTYYNIPEQLESLTGGSKDAEVTVFHVITQNELAGYVRYKSMHWEDVVEKKKEDMKPFLEVLKEKGLSYNIKFGSKGVTEDVVTEANTGDYEIIVMSNKRTQLELKHVLGHVTHKVVKRVHKPVLVVK